MTRPFTFLARIVQHLAANGRIELPFIDGPRGNQWSEHFYVGPDPFDRDAVVPCLLHGNKVRRRDVVMPMRDEPCQWSLDDMLRSMQEWDEPTMTVVLADLPELTPGRSAHVDAIAALDDLPDGSVVSAYASHWVSRRHDGVASLFHDGNADWTLDTLVIGIQQDALVTTPH